jgi:two-component system, sensor histidine kinase
MITMNEITKKLNIVYAEDDLVIAQQLVKILRRVFKSVEHFENGRLAFEYLAKQDNVDLIITDLTMPVMNGIELIKKIKTELSTNAPIVVVTAHTSDYTEDLDKLDVFIINKPLSIDSFLENLQKIITQKYSPKS